MDAFSRARRLAAAGLLSLVVLPVASATAQDPPRIAPGVTTGGVDLSGLSVPEATAKLQATLAPVLATDVVVRAAGRTFTLKAADTKTIVYAQSTAEKALKAAPSAPASGGGGVAAGTEVPLAGRHAKIPVKAFAQKIAAAVTRPGTDASLQIGLRKMHIKRAKTGITIDASALAKRIDAVLDNPAEPRTLTQRVKTLYPATNANDLRSQYRTVITVDKAHFKLRLFKELKLRKTYGVAIGQPAYPTPVGRFRIQDKQIDPVWSVPNSPWAGELGGTTVAGGSAANPLKARWMGITDGVGIHGTGEDWSIGSAASHGCLRMHVADVKDLFPRVPVGTTVLIR